MTTRLRFAMQCLALACAALIAMSAFAQQDAAPAATALPAWDQLTPAQRETLIAPVRDRWNDSDAEHRQRTMDHAQRWATMSPEERQAARKGMHRWSNMSPEQRDHARELYDRMRSMPPDQRRALKEKWRAMTPEQKKAWLEANPPKP